MSNKPKDLYPKPIKNLLRKLLPFSLYRRYLGRHEEGSLSLWKQLASDIPSGNVILDIGAFNGDYALAARNVNPGVAIYAFEPNPASASGLRRTVAGLDIQVQEIAVTEQDGFASFLLASAMSRITYSDLASGENVLQVQAMCLDSWVNQHKAVLSLLKIDTEDAEAAILRGGQQALHQHEPVILCEVLTDEAGEAVMKALPTGYLFYHIDENDGIEARHSVTRKKWRNRNWLFIPVSKKHLAEKINKNSSI